MVKELVLNFDFNMKAMQVHSDLVLFDEMQKFIISTKGVTLWS